MFVTNKQIHLALQLATMIAFSIVCGSAFATSGRTDKNGCHNSKKIGYHCHGAATSSHSTQLVTSDRVPSITTQKINNTAEHDSIKENSVVKNNSDLVMMIQMFLKELGYYNGKIDGVLGNRTKSAILEFQKAKGLKQDGVANNDLLSRLISEKANN
ncbi:peptidoglycan-binding protein [Pseudoalteromonas xiamenensis]